MNTSLLEKFKESINIPFPDDSEDPVVSDVHAELAEYDGYMAGLILSFAKGNLERKSKIVYDDSLEQRLIKRLQEKPELKQELESYFVFLNKIKDLVEMVQNS